MAGAEGAENIHAGLGGLAAPVNYSQWQRTSLPPEIKPTRVDKQYKPTVFTVAHNRRDTTSTVCHPHSLKKKRELEAETLLNAEEKKRAERIKILQLRIKSRRQTLEDYKRRKHRILEENLDMKKSMESTETESHITVNGYLRKYEKYRDGISILNNNFTKEMDIMKSDLETTGAIVQHSLTDLEERVASIDAQLQKRQKYLHILLNYKDKEYPVKAIKISDLQNEIEDLKISNEEEEDDLQYIINTEIGKIQRAQQKLQSGMTENITEDAISKMHPSLKDMAMQNIVMKKEVEFHNQHTEDLQTDIDALQEEVQHLLRSPKTNIKLQLFPEFFPSAQKCTPDTDVVLDIPKQEWLPI